jgi:hypothetical protein
LTSTSPRRSQSDRTNEGGQHQVAADDEGDREALDGCVGP